MTYGILATILLIAELVYFKIVDHFNIIDKPNERSSHSTIVLRGGGIIFSLSMIVWAVMMVAQGEVPGQARNEVLPYLPSLCGLVMICTVSFWDDVHSLPDSARMAVPILSTLLMFRSVGLYAAFDSWVWMVVPFNRAGALDLSGGSWHRAGHGVCAIQKEVLSPPRRVFEIIGEMRITQAILDKLTEEAKASPRL